MNIQRISVRRGGDLVDLVFGPGDATNVAHRVVRHSPTGLSWGYGGSGPADTALNALLLFLPRAVAERHYQRFKWDVIAKLDWNPKGGARQVVRAETVIEWIRAHVDHVDHVEEADG